MARRTNRGTPRGGAGQDGPNLTAVGATWQPAPVQDIQRIADAALDILTTIGVSDAPGACVDVICRVGGTHRDGRLFYPRDFLLQMLQDRPKTVLLAGQSAPHDMHVGGTGAYVGTGGAAPNVVDLETGRYSPARLQDLHSAARLADALPHIHFFARSLVAQDVACPRELDIATTAASLLGTQKHVMVQATDPSHVADIAQICYDIAGGAAQFRARPFLSLNINHVVPPLRLHGESMDVMAAAVRAGIPVHCNVFGQLGASSPVTLAGSVAQTVAETLAGLGFVHALDPTAPCIAGPRPMITDLKTGGMAGGAGEQILATGLAAQVFRHWDLPCSVIAGATDSKLVDFQSGYEKALTIDTAIRAGANLVTQSAGAQAALMGVSFVAMVADNDMLGAILRGSTPISVTDETLALGAIADVVAGEGHFLGRPETYARMRSDFLYPDVADRMGFAQWEAAGADDMATRASTRAREILANHWPNHGPSGLAGKFGLTQQKAKDIS